ncbi:MAG: hypothetical protein IT536_01150 [Hyphomicrobiales bacterium]|nr:hypothetical protein [Hyphomicrobiales bacterium]
MNATEQVSMVLSALADVLGPVSALGAGAWLVSSLVLAYLLVWSWRRLIGR